MDSTGEKGDKFNVFCYFVPFCLFFSGFISYIENSAQHVSICNMHGNANVIKPYAE